jgi:hypothetical protein
VGSSTIEVARKDAGVADAENWWLFVAFQDTVPEACLRVEVDSPPLRGSRNAAGITRSKGVNAGGLQNQFVGTGPAARARRETLAL